MYNINLDYRFSFRKEKKEKKEKREFPRWKKRKSREIFAGFFPARLHRWRGQYVTVPAVRETGLLTLAFLAVERTSGEKERKGKKKRDSTKREGQVVSHTGFSGISRRN